MSDPTAHMPSTLDGSDDLFAPPEDFGAAVLAEFERREQNAKPDVDAAPPGGFPGKSVDDAVPVSLDVDGATPDPDGSSGETPPGDADGDGAAAGSAPDGGNMAPSSGAPLDDGTAPPAAPADTGATLDDAPPDPAVTDPVTDPASATATAADGYVWRMDDREVTFTDDQVQRAIGLAAWAEGLPEQMRTQFSAIEAGQAVAIPRADFDAFTAWQRQQSRTTRDADLDSLDVDPDVAKLIGDMRDEIAQLRGTAPDPAVPDATTATIAGNLDATAQQFDAATRSYGETRGLSPDELDVLMAEAVASNIIPSLMEAGSTFNPVTGALLAPADIAQVTEQALDFALIRNPALHSRVITGQQSPAASSSTGSPAGHAAGTTPPPSPANPSPSTPDPVLAKRARASSLATAPSAAVATPPRSTDTMSPQDRVNAMAAELEAALARS